MLSFSSGSSKMPPRTFGMTSTSNHSFCEMIIMVTRGGYIWEVITDIVVITYIHNYIYIYYIIYIYV